MSFDRHSQRSRDVLASLNASLAKLEREAKSAADLSYISEMKRKLLLRIAELESNKVKGVGKDL